MLNGWMVGFMPLVAMLKSLLIHSYSSDVE